MRRLWKMRWLGVAVLLAAGCRSTDNELKPKHQPEEYVAPPEGDARYNGVMTYPKNTLFQDVIKKDAPEQKDPFKMNTQGMGNPATMR